MKKILSNKRNGSMDQFVASIITFLLEATLLVFVINTFAISNYRDNIDQIARAEILKLETTGELNRNTVVEDFNNRGFKVTNTDVVINNGASGKVDCGNPVSILVEYDAQSTDIGTIGSRILGGTHHIRIYRESISKAR